MTVAVRCVTCLYEGRWTAEQGEVEVINAGGQRQAAEAPDLAGFRVWARSLGGELGPVVGCCAGCGQPLVADGPGLPQGQPWVARTGRGTFEIGPDGASGPGGSMTVDAALAMVHGELTPTLADQVFDPRLLFVGVLLFLVLVVFAMWLGAFGFVLNWFYAIGTQGNFTGPQA